MDLPATGGRWSRDPQTGAVVRIDEESDATTAAQAPEAPKSDAGTSTEEEH